MKHYFIIECSIVFEWTPLLALICSFVFLWLGGLFCVEVFFLQSFNIETL